MGIVENILKGFLKINMTWGGNINAMFIKWWVILWAPKKVNNMKIKDEIFLFIFIFRFWSFSKSKRYMKKEKYIIIDGILKETGP